MPLFETLEQRNAKSPHAAQLAAGYLVALNQSAPAKVLPAAERMPGSDPGNPDLLLIVAGAYMNKRQNNKALAASAKLTGAVGRAYWYIGIINAVDEKWVPADQALRNAMPLIRNNEGLAGPALFHLGLANYKMGKGKNKAQMADALKFSEQSATIKGPFQAKAAQNVKAIREGK